MEDNTFGLLGQQKLQQSQENQSLQAFETQQEVAQRREEAKALNKNSTGNYQLDRARAEWQFNKQQEIALKKAGIQKAYADKQAYDSYQIDKNYDINSVQVGGGIAPNRTTMEQAILGQNSSLEGYLRNEENRNKQLDKQLQANQNQYDKLAALMGVDKEQFYKNLQAQDWEYEQNIQAAKIANAPFLETMNIYSNFLSSSDGRYDTSYWAALYDGIANGLDSMTDIGGTLVHFLMNGNLEDYETTSWFKRNMGGYYKSQYESPLSNDSWWATANLKALTGMGISSVGEFIPMIVAALVSGGAVPVLRVGQLANYFTKMSSLARHAGKIEQAAFFGMVGKSLPKAAQYTLASGIEGQRRALQIVGDRQEIYGGKFDYQLGDFLTGVASAGLDYTGAIAGLKGVGTHWNKIKSKLALVPQAGVRANIAHNLPKIAGGLVTNTAPGALLEGGTEFIQTALEMSRIHNVDLSDFIDVLSSDNAKYNGLKHQLLDAAAVGGLMGSAFGGVGQVRKGIIDAKNYYKEKRALENAPGNPNTLYSTKDANSTAEIDASIKPLHTGINNAPNLNVNDKNTMTKFATQMQTNLTQKLSEEKANETTNPEASAKNKAERVAMSEIADNIKVFTAMTQKALPEGKTGELFKSLNDTWNNSNLSWSQKNTDIKNQIASFIKNNPEVHKTFKTIISNANKKDMAAFFKQFDIDVDIPEAKTKDSAKNAQTDDSNLSPEEKARRDEILKEAKKEANEDLFETDTKKAEPTTQQTEQPKETKQEGKSDKKNTNKRRVKIKEKPTKNSNVKNQQETESSPNIENASPIIQDENNVKLDTGETKLKEAKAKEVMSKLVDYIGETPEGIKQLLEFKASNNTNATRIFPRELRDLAYKSNEEIKQIFKERNQTISDKDIDILKQMASQVENPTPREVYNDTITLQEFEARIKELHSLQYKLMNYSLDYATNTFANFKSQEIESTQALIAERLDYFTNFINHNLSDFTNLDASLTDIQKDTIAKQLYLVAGNLETLTQNYEKLLNVTHQDTRKLFKLVPNKDSGLIERILKYIISLVERISSLGKMLSASLANHTFKNKQQLEYGLDTIHNNMLAFQENYSNLKTSLNNIRALNTEVRVQLESSPLFLNVDGTSKTFNIGDSELFLTKKSQQNLYRYLPILHKLGMLSPENLEQKFVNIFEHLNKIKEGKYADDHLVDFAYSGLTKLINSPYVLNEQGQIEKVDKDSAEARNIIAQASVIGVLNAIASRENDKHNLNPDKVQLISGQELDKEIIRNVEDILNVEIPDIDVKLGIASLGFLMLQEINTDAPALQFEKYSFSENVYEFVNRLKEKAPADRLAYIHSTKLPFKWKNGFNPDGARAKDAQGNSLPATTPNSAIIKMLEEQDYHKLMDYFQSNVELEKDFEKKPKTIINSYFQYPISNVSIYSLILEQVKTEKLLNNSLSSKFLPLEKPITRKYASKVVNTANQFKYGVNPDVKKHILEDLGVTLDDIEEVPSITKSNLNALKKEYLNQGNLVNQDDIMNPNYYFPIFNVKNPDENIKYYRFKDLNKYKEFMAKVGFETNLKNQNSILRGGKIEESLMSKIRGDNTDIGELMTLLLFPDNYYPEFYYERNEQNQQRLEVKTNLFNPQRNKLIRPLIELRDWYHNGKNIPQTEKKLYKDMTPQEKEGIILALSLVITNDKVDKPSVYNPETGYIEYQLDDTFPTRESIAKAIETEEGRNKLLPYLEKRGQEIVLADEPYIELMAKTLSDWFKNGFKEFNPNTLVIELDGRSTGIMEQGLHSNASKDITNKLGMQKGYQEFDAFESMLATNSTPIFKEQNSVQDVINALDNNYPYGVLIANTFRALQIKTPMDNSVEIHTTTDFRNTISPSGYVNHTGGAEGADSTWARIGNIYGVTSNNYTAENTTLGDKTLKPTFIAETTLKQFDNDLVEINTNHLQRQFPLHKEAGNNLLRRDMIQANNADAIFAIGHILAPGDKTYWKNSKGETQENIIKLPQVEGGEGWAVAKAKIDKKPIYVFDQQRNKWYKSVYKEDGSLNMVATDTPVLTKHFAGIGTKHLQPNGIKAIRDVYEKTFGKTIAELQPNNKPKQTLEVSTRGDAFGKQFSALNAKFKPDTMWNDYNIGNMTIEEVYQSIVKQSGKNQPPKETSIVYNPNLKTKEEREDYSYEKGFLPLWKLWAEQNPQLIQQLKTRVDNGAVLIDSFAKTRVSQARALTDIIQEMNRTSRKKLEPNLKATMTYAYGNQSRENITAPTTFEAIKRGERTATTRFSNQGHIDYWKKAKIGDIIQFSDGKGDTLFVRVTKPLTQLTKDTPYEEWGKKEGWNKEFFDTKMKPAIDKGQGYQLEYEYIPTDSEGYVIDTPQIPLQIQPQTQVESKPQYPKMPITKNPFIDTLLALTDIKTYTDNDSLTSKEAAKMYKTLRDIAKKFLIPINYGSQVDSVIQSTNSESLYNYLVETFANQLSSIISLYNPNEHKTFENFVNGLLNPNSKVIDEKIKNEGLKYHIRAFLTMVKANSQMIDENNLGRYLDKYLDNEQHLTAFHTLGNSLNLNDVIALNKRIDSAGITDIANYIKSFEYLENHSFTEIMKYIQDNANTILKEQKDGSYFIDIPKDDNSLHKTMKRYLVKGEWLNTWANDKRMRAICRYLMMNPKSFTEVDTTIGTKTNYRLKMNNGFIYEALDDYKESSAYRSAATKIMTTARNKKFMQIFEKEIQEAFNRNMNNFNKDYNANFQEGIQKGIEAIDKWLDNQINANPDSTTLNPTDSFRLAKIKENISQSELRKNEENIKELINKLYEGENLTYNASVFNKFITRGKDANANETTERFQASITRLALKTTIHLIEHNLEAWVMGNITLDTPVTMSVYDAAITSTANARAVQDGWNSHFEEGAKKVSLYSLPNVLIKEYPDTIEEALEQNPREANILTKYANFIYDTKYNNIIMGGTKIDKESLNDIHSYRLKDMPLDNLEAIRNLFPGQLPFAHRFPSVLNNLVETYGQETIDNAKYISNQVLLLPEDYSGSTPQSMKLGTLYNKLKEGKLTEQEYYQELDKEIDKGLTLPYTFGSTGNKPEKNTFIRQSVLKAMKGLDFQGDVPRTPEEKPTIRNQRDTEEDTESAEITNKDIENSSVLDKESMFEEINNYIDSLDGLSKSVAQSIFTQIRKNLPDNLQFLYNPNISTKGMYVQDKNQHYIIIGDNSSPNTLLHEIIHASIEDAMNRKTIAAKNIVSEITSIMNYVRHRLEGNPELMSELNFLKSDGTTNKVYEEIFVDNDISEFLAYFLTDKEKLEFLNNEHSKSVLQGTTPAYQTFVGKTFHFLGRLLKAVMALLSPDKWKNYNAYSTLDETLTNKLVELSDFNKEANYKSYKEKPYVQIIDALNDFAKNMRTRIFQSTFSDVETFARDNNLTTEDIEKSIYEFQQEFVDANLKDGKTLRRFLGKIMNPKNMLNPVKRRAIWELFGMFNNTQAEGAFKFVSQIMLDLNLLSKNSSTAQSIRLSENLSNKIQVDMSQQQMAYDMTKKSVVDTFSAIMGEKYQKLKELDKDFKQPTPEELAKDIYNRKQYAPSIQFERDIGELLYNLKLSDALDFGYKTMVSNDEIKTLLNDMMFASEVELDNKLQEILQETKANLFNMIGRKMGWKNINDIPTDLSNYIFNATSILGYSRLSRQTSRAGFTNVEDIMRKTKHTPLVNIYYAISENVKPGKDGVNKEFIARKNQYYAFFNSMKKLTTYQAIQAMNRQTPIAEYHRLKRENLIKVFEMKDEITDDFNALMTGFLVKHANYEKRAKTLVHYSPIDEAKIIELQNEFYRLSKNNENPERQQAIKDEINDLEMEAFKRFNDFRDTDFREAYYLDYRVPYAINADISLKTIEANRDASYYAYITNNTKIGTQEEAINFLQELGYQFIDFNGKVTDTRDYLNPNVTMRYNGYNRYEDTRVNIAYLGSSDMAAGNLLSDSALPLDEQEKVQNLATIQMNKEIASLIDNSWQFEVEVFDDSFKEYRPIGNSTKEFRTLTGRLAHNNMTEVDTRVSELLANEHKEIVKNTTIERVNVDLARALIHDNEMFRNNKLYQNQIDNNKYVKIFDLEKPQTIDKEFYGKLSSEAFATFKKVLDSYNENKPEEEKIKQLYINPLTTTYLFGFKNSKFSNVIKSPQWRKYFNGLETTIDSLFRENKTNVIIRNPKVVLANGLSNMMSLTGLGYPVDTILNSIEPLQEELKHYKKMQRELFEVENEIMLLQDVETLDESYKIELDNLVNKRDRLKISMSKSRVHIPMQNGFDTNIIDETLQEPDEMDKLHLKIEKFLPKGLQNEKTTNILNELMMTSNSEYYQNLQNLNRLGDIIPKILAYEFALEEGKSEVEAIRFAQDYFVNYNIPITSPFLRGIEKSGAGFFLKWGLRTQKTAINSFLDKPVSTTMSLVASNIIAPHLMSPIGGESFISKGLPLGQSLDISNYFRWGFLFK